MSNSVPNNSRLMVFYRVCIAVIGGYLLASSSGLFLSFSLPVGRDEAITIASMFSFLTLVTSIIWVFAVKRWQTAFLGLVSANLLFALLAFSAWMLELNQ